MEATQPPPPEETPTPAPAPARTDSGMPEKPGAGVRILALLFALVLAFLAAVMILVAVDINDTPTCDDLISGVVEIPEDRECFDGSSTAKTVSVGLAWASGFIGVLAALAGLWFTITGRRGRLLVSLAVSAIVLGILSILVGSL